MTVENDARSEGLIDRTLADAMKQLRARLRSMLRAGEVGSVSVEVSVRDGLLRVARVKEEDVFKLD